MEPPGGLTIQKLFVEPPGGLTVEPLKGSTRNLNTNFVEGIDGPTRVEPFRGSTRVRPLESSTRKDSFAFYQELTKNEGQKSYSTCDFHLFYHLAIKYSFKGGNVN